VVLSISFSGAEDGDDGPFALAPLSVWSALTTWAAALPGAEFPAVRALAADGRADDTAALAEQLAAALEAHPPHDPAVLAAAGELAAALGPGDRTEEAVVSDDAEDR
jgi:hypothetical protein